MMKLCLSVAFLLAQIFAQGETGVITGTVTSLSGSPAVGVRVAAMSARDGGAGEVMVSLAETDARGRYRLERIEPGDYYIRAGFVETPTYYPGVTALSKAKKVSVTRGATVTGLDFPILGSTGAKLSGRVIWDPRQKPLSVEPQISLAEGAPIMAETRIAADGSFAFEKVPPGTYSVLIRGAASIRGIVVGMKDVSGIELRPPLRVEVKGRVVAPNDAPSGLGLLFSTPGRSVRLAPPGEQVSAALLSVRAELSDDGTFTVVLLEATYRLVFDNVPQGFFVQSAVYGSTDLLRNPLSIPTNDSGELVITLARSRDR